MVESDFSTGPAAGFSYALLRNLKFVRKTGKNMNYDLSFVHLGITIGHMVNHVDVFGFRIAFYGIIIGIGMMAGMAVALSDAKRRGQDADLYLDFIIYGIIFAIIGARIYYVAFSWDAYKNDPIQILNLRAGGLAIYGGVIAGLLTLFIYARKKKQSFFSMADTLVLGLLTGQIIGRWGNFFNCEAFGRFTDSLFAMRIRMDIVNPIMINDELLKHVITMNGTEYIQVHPTFLYESVWNLCLLIFILQYRKHKKFIGEMLFVYLGGYGFGRMIIEGLRTDQLRFAGTGIAVSQIFAGVCFAVSTVIIIRGRKMAAEARKKLLKKSTDEI